MLEMKWVVVTKDVCVPKRRTPVREAPRKIDLFEADPVPKAGEHVGKKSVVEFGVVSRDVEAEEVVAVIYKALQVADRCFVVLLDQHTPRWETAVDFVPKFPAQEPVDRHIQRLAIEVV